MVSVQERGTLGGTLGRNAHHRKHPSASSSSSAVISHLEKMTCGHRKSPKSKSEETFEVTETAESRSHSPCSSWGGIPHLRRLRISLHFWQGKRAKAKAKAQRREQGKGKGNNNFNKFGDNIRTSRPVSATLILMHRPCATTPCERERT